MTSTVSNHPESCNVSSDMESFTYLSHEIKPEAGGPPPSASTLEWEPVKPQSLC